MAKRSAKRASTTKTISKKAAAKKAASKQKPLAKKPLASKKALAKKAAVAPAKTTAAKKSAAKKIIAKPSAAKPSAAKPSAAKPSAAKKIIAKPSAAKAPAAKTPAAKAPAGKAPIAKPSAAKAPAAKKAAAKKAPATMAAPSTPRATPARDARSALARKRAIEATLSPAVNGKEVVDAYMRDVDHPFKAEMQAVRQIILGVSPKMSERIKWNAPSFFYKEDFAAFHPRATEFVHLIVLFPGGVGMDDDSGLLEGSHKDRREAKFYGMDDVAAKKPRLEKLVKRWLALRDA
jgi:hypothetical protein